MPADGRSLEKCSSEDKFAIVLEAASLNGAKLAQQHKTYQRWTQDEAVLSDRHPGTQCPAPTNKLSPEEQEEIFAITNSPAFRSLPQTQ